MIICRLMTTLFITVLHTMTGDCSTEDSSSIARETIHVNVGKRVRMECELANSITTSNMKGLWLRLEDAEVFFYATSRIHSDQRFQIEQRPILHILNGTSSYEVMTYSLTIDDVRLSDDGTYSCQADNRIIKLYVLNVVERPYFVTHEYSTLLRTQIGKNVSIACEAQGKPSPFVSWIKKMDDNHQKTMINCTTTPTICQMNLLNVNRWHHGIYECVATNTIATIGRFYELDVQFPPDVQSSISKSLHSIGDTITLQCLIDSNPEPDIRWFHRFNNDINQQIDISRQIDQGIPNGNYQHNISVTTTNRRMTPTWSIEQEQINSTRWQTTLIVKHLPKRFFNSSFICRAVNRHGQDEKSILIQSNHHYHHHHASKKHRHTSTAKITTIETSTIAFEPLNEDDERSLSFTTHSSSQDLKDLTSNHSGRITPYLFYSFLLGLFIFLSK